jgi:KaiC/GvpD/RAD55 family RecA-like ATPase
MPKKLNAKGLKRILRGWTGITQRQLNIAGNNLLWLASSKARRNSIKKLEKQIKALEKNKRNSFTELELTWKKILLESIKKEKALELTELQEALKEKSNELVIRLGSRYGLDSINEFNPETRRFVTKRVKIIINNLHRKDVYSTNAVNAAWNEITAKLGKARAVIFVANVSVTTRKLRKHFNKIIQELKLMG